MIDLNTLSDYIVRANHDAARERNALSMWTVYDHPKDFKDHYVARRHETSSGQSIATFDVVLSKDLEVLREAMLYCGLICMTRDPNDDPNIVETWM